MAQLALQKKGGDLAPHAESIMNCDDGIVGMLVPAPLTNTGATGACDMM